MSDKRIAATPAGLVSIVLSAVLVVGMPIIGYSQAANFTEGMERAALWLAGSIALVVALRFLTGIYLRFGALFAVANLMLVAGAFQKTGDYHLHISFWCQLAQKLEIHHLYLEWVAALLLTVGWIAWPNPLRRRRKPAKIDT